MTTWTTLVGAALLAAAAGPAAGAPAADDAVLRGRNIVLTERCNDCHTAGYRDGGAVPESRWLTGGRTLSGPWGVSRPPNLRAVAGKLTPAQWVELARNGDKRPPMPRHHLSGMSDADLLALYRFIRSLGPPPGAAPAGRAR